MNAPHDDWVAFYMGVGYDGSGRHPTHYYMASRTAWGRNHDMIQWAFPLNVPSQFNPNAPLLDLEQLKQDPFLKELKLTQLCMLYFYLGSVGIGIHRTLDTALGDLVETDGVIYTFFPFALDNGMSYQTFTEENHQHLRMTRVLTSLRLFGHNYIALQLGEFLLQLAEENPQMINNTTREFWLKAMRGPL
jgi:hypothetical protein